MGNVVIANCCWFDEMLDPREEEKSPRTPRSPPYLPLIQVSDNSGSPRRNLYNPSEDDDDSGSTWSEGDMDEHRHGLKQQIAVLRRESQTMSGMLPVSDAPGVGMRLAPLDQGLLTPGVSMPTPDYENPEENAMRNEFA